MDPLKWMFLRLYALNLEARTRNDPRTACRDAITQAVTIMGVPVLDLVVLPMLWISPSELNPHSSLMISIIVSSGVLLCFLTWNFRQYDTTPTIADRYRSKLNRRVTGVLCFAIPAAALAVLTAILSHAP